MSTAALFELVAEYRSAGQALSEMDIDAQTIDDTLEGMSGALESKMQAIAYVSMNLGYTAQAIRAHAANQLDRAGAIEARSQALRDYLARGMEAAGIEKVEGPGVKISFRRSSAVVIDGEDLIPSEFMRSKEAPPPAPDKAALSKALKAGADIPGCHLEARKLLQIA